MKNSNTTTQDYLVEYVFDFYGGNDPVWDFFKNSPITQEEVERAVKVHRNIICPVTWDHNGYCDSFDREMVREVLFIQKGMTTNIKEQLEYGGFMLKFFTPKGKIKKKYQHLIEEPQK